MNKVAYDFVEPLAAVVLDFLVALDIAEDIDIVEVDQVVDFAVQHLVSKGQDSAHLMVDKEIVLLKYLPMYEK